MKKNGHGYRAVLWLFFFVWVDTLPFGGALYMLNGINFTLCYVLLATFRYSEPAAAALSIAGGVLLGMLTGSFAHLAAFTAVFFAAKLLKEIFYRPGSVAHILSYAPLAAAANAILYYGGAAAWPGFSRTPLIFLLELSGADYCWFLALLILFRDRNRAVLYKIR